MKWIFRSRRSFGARRLAASRGRASSDDAKHSGVPGSDGMASRQYRIVINARNDRNNRIPTGSWIFRVRKMGTRLIVNAVANRMVIRAVASPTGSGTNSPHRPIIRKTSKMFDWRTCPISSICLPFLATLMATTMSGSDVPTAMADAASMLEPIPS